MANPVDTPQVILGLDRGGTFQDFEARRRQGGSYLSDWYAEAASKGTIWLSTIENNDVISFSHKFNSDSPDDQSLFVFEVLDPTNTFEHRLFKTFYEGAASFEKIMEDHALKIMSMSEPSDSPVQKTVNKLGSLPGTVPMYVTFGMGNDLAGWSPAVKCSLVTFDYGMTDEGVKKLILRFVPNTGAVRLNSASMIEEYLKSTSNTKISHSELVMVDSTTSTEIPGTFGATLHKGSVSVKNPVNLVFDIFKNMIKSITKSNVVFLLDELKTPLLARWNTMVIAAGKQHMKSLDNIKTVGLVDSGLASDAAHQYLHNILLPALDEGGSTWGKITDEELEEGVSVSISEEALEKQKAHVTAAAKAEAALPLSQAARDARARNADPYESAGDRLGPRGTSSESRWNERPGWLYRGDGGLEGMSAEEFFKVVKHGTPWEDAFWRSMGNALGGHIYRALEEEVWGETLYKTKENIKKRIESMPYEVLGSPESIHFYKFFYSHRGYPVEQGGGVSPTGGKNPSYTTGIILNPKETAADFYKQLQIAMDSDAWREGPLRYLGAVHGESAQENAQVYYNKLREKWPESIKLIDRDIYVIFTTAFENFCATLGLTTGPVGLPKPQTGGGGIPLAGSKINGRDEGASTKKLQEDEMKKQLYINITVDTAEELKAKLRDMIDGLDAGPSVHLTMQSFSELSLIDNLTKAVGDDTILPTGTAPDGSLKTKEILFVTSVRVLASLVSNVGLDDETQELLASNKLYQSIKTGYKIFNDGEPSIHSSENVPFSQLFDNPDMEELKLDTDNILTLFSEDKKLKFDDNEKLNKYLLDHNIPVFNYGFKNSNILNFNFSLKLWFAHMLGILPHIPLMGAKIPSVKDADIDESLLKFWKSAKAGENFTKSVGDFWDKYIKDPNSEEYKEITKVWEAAFWNDPNRYSPEADNRERYINAMTKVFKASMSNLNNPDYLLINPENQDSAMRMLLDIRRAMASRIFTAKITTLPFFSFISAGKVIGKTALLYFIEPEILTSVGSKDKRTRSTWLSGSYLIVGYDVTMSNSRLTTSFNLMKQ